MWVSDQGKGMRGGSRKIKSMSPIGGGKGEERGVWENICSNLRSGGVRKTEGRECNIRRVRSLL